MSHRRDSKESHPKRARQRLVSSVNTLADWEALWEPAMPGISISQGEHM